jgi:hypothetical protein
LIEAPDLPSETLYGLRRDAEGVPSTLPARQKDPPTTELLGFFHLLLRAAGAVPVAEGYTYGGRTIRVVNGSGAFLSTVRDRFKEPPALRSADLVACVGAKDQGLPGHLVRRSIPGHIIRTASRAVWLDIDAARRELGI